MNSATEGEETRGSAPAHDDLPRPLSVLVVEDDEALRAEMVELLGSDGHRVLEAAHGASALEILRRKEPVDLVLLDLWMPTMDGWSFRVRQRDDAALRDIPVIVLTADDGAPARAIDADAVLQKPFQPDALSATVRRVVAERRGQVDQTATAVAKTLSLLVGAVSHEVASPLMVLISWLERFRQRNAAQVPSRAADGTVDDMLAQCWRIADTLRTLRALPYPTWVRESKVDVTQLMQAVIAGAQADPLQIRFEGEAGLVVHGEPLVVLYACTTLLHHAIEAFPRAALVDGSMEPHVKVRVQRLGASVVVELDDRGPRIPDEDLHRVFTIDYTGRTRAWSAGLRLWYVRHAIEGLGGTVQIKNLEPTGVRCRLCLPV